MAQCIPITLADDKGGPFALLFGVVKVVFSRNPTSTILAVSCEKYAPSTFMAQGAVPKNTHVWNLDSVIQHLLGVAIIQLTMNGNQVYLPDRTKGFLIDSALEL